MSDLSHLDAQGRARMVDVGDKPVTHRVAKATGWLRCLPDTLTLVADGRAPKGSVVATAELAGVMAAKRTADLIPLCHPLPLTKIAVTIKADAGLPGFQLEAEVRTAARTGVEMEAMTAISVACLTLFDMLKAVDRSMEIGGISVAAKSGGSAGAWSRP
ncbi:cyclic pyranopterin monophosphate synthase MoaC [Sphingomonas sp. TX0543]|uniref:cyclic pyranopterin monophosphate synthase MoaC n=1 Tax=Sphingomonas sp. TX0543 TaxID=3399682 RepID=UPI003AFB032B